MAIGLFIIFAIIIALQVPELIQNKLWRELAVYTVLLTLGIVYSFGLIYNWPLPNPTKKMELIFEPVTKILNKILLS